MGVDNIDLLSPLGCLVASSVGGAVETPSKYSVAGGIPVVIGTGREGQACLALYNGLSMSLINAVFVDFVIVVRRSKKQLRGIPISSHISKIKHSKGRVAL